MHISAAEEISHRLLPAVNHLRTSLAAKVTEFEGIVKIGRTHLMDAVPLTLSQEFIGYVAQLDADIRRIEFSLEDLHELALGGTAVGTGLNSHPEFADLVAERIARRTGLPFTSADNKFSQLAAHDAIVAMSGTLNTLAVSLMKLANDIRWLGSGPRCALGEFSLPENEPGSSIMPGKVNPVMCESMMQVAARVIGNDAVIAFSGATGGQFQLNIMMPVMGQTTLESITLLTRVTNAFVEFCSDDMQANNEACEAAVEKSLSMCTSLNPLIGYENAAAIAKEAFKTGKTIRELCLEKDVLPEDTLAEALDPMRMTEPQA